MLDHDQNSPKSKRIWRTIVVYLGGAWVIIEALNFVVDKYHLSSAVIDLIIILVIAGLPITIINFLNDRKLTPVSISLHLMILTLAAILIGFNYNNPNLISAAKMRLFRFQDDQKALAESIRSMVILPFDNYTGNKELDYYVAGMHSAMIVDVGKISALRVISKTSSMSVEKMGKTISTIASDLNVDAVIEASVSCIGQDSVCIHIQLVSAFPEEKQLWSQDYYEDKTQIENLYHKVSKKISEEINVMLTPQEEVLLAKSKPVNKKAYDLYLKGLFYLDQINKESLEAATKYFKLAIEEDPDWAPPYGGLADTGGYQQQMGFVPPPVIKPLIYNNTDIALSLDPNAAGSYHSKAVMAVWTEWDWQKGEEAFIKAIELNPNNALSHMFYAHLLLTLQRPQEAKEQCKIALDLDPLRPFVLGLATVVQQSIGQYEYAVQLSEKALSIEPNHYFATWALEGAYYHNNEYTDSYKTLLKVYGLENDSTLRSLDQITTNQEYKTELRLLVKRLEEINEATGFILPGAFAFYYLRLDELDKAVHAIIKGYEIHDPSQPYFATAVEDFYKLKDHPDFLDILQKMNLQVKY